ncbi:hypothetical protein [Pyxidicoccus sp. MSG2]|uniref:hypothetical protein n=1 Tax=Pyxidicoccus sp. MSG2 TaxID=2996790 RepID=UPI0022710CFE|nr:hypothetical protein [Pyxidicoccus sp. MSG2]MCY1022074.1 hypothetical protein [Pyxidicoccus sp. MSG2]
MFDVTRANMPRLQDASEEWIRESLRALGLGDATPRTWKVQPLRTHFYSDYPGEPEWRDRWPIAWSVEVTLDSHPGTSARPSWDEPVFVDALDETWSGDFDDAPHDRTALVIAAFVRRKAVVDPLTREVQGAAGLGNLQQVSTRPRPPTSEQTRLLIEVPDFERSVSALEGLLPKIQGLGGVVNWRQLDG